MIILSLKKQYNAYPKIIYFMYNYIIPHVFGIIETSISSMCLLNKSLFVDTYIVLFCQKRYEIL